MAGRHGISYEQVAEACERLRREQGEKAATINAVRAVLGTGSKGKLVELVGRWRDENMRQAPAIPKVELTPEDQERVIRFAREMLGVLLERDRVVREHERAEATERETLLEGRIATLNADLEAMAQEVDAGEAKLSELSAEAEPLRERVSRSEAAAAAAREIVTAAERRADDLAIRLDLAERRAETVQQHASEAQAALAVAEQRVRDLEERLGDARADVKRQATQIAALTDRLTELARSHGRADAPTV